MAKNGSNQRDTHTQAHFGMRPVDPSARQDMVNEVFDKVANRYDLMNDVMSAGLHRLWKGALIEWLAPPKSDRRFAVLDVAGGTGDVALRIAAAGGRGTQVTICDINPSMIAEGRKRAQARRPDGGITYAAGNAEHLPFPERSFDAYTIAFGIRNVTDIEAALSEAYRILRPGGRFLCLEFSSVDVPGLDVLYEVYSNAAIPALGKAITGDGAPYRYLVESIAKFPNQRTFSRMMTDAGFARVKFRNLSGGIVAMHSAWRL